MDIWLLSCDLAGWCCWTESDPVKMSKCWLISSPAQTPLSDIRLPQLSSYKPWIQCNTDISTSTLLLCFRDYTFWIRDYIKLSIKVMILNPKLFIYFFSLYMTIVLMSLNTHKMKKKQLSLFPYLLQLDLSFLLITLWLVLKLLFIYIFKHLSSL